MRSPGRRRRSEPGMPPRHRRRRQRTPSRDPNHTPEPRWKAAARGEPWCHGFLRDFVVNTTPCMFLFFFLSCLARHESEGAPPAALVWQNRLLGFSFWRTSPVVFKSGSRFYFFLKFLFLVASPPVWARWSPFLVIGTGRQHAEPYGTANKAKKSLS